QRDQDVPEVLALPGRRPRRDRPLPDGQGVVGYQAPFVDLVDPADAMTIGTGALRRVGREGFRVKQRLAAWIVAGARVEHPQQIRQCGDTSHRGPSRWRSSLLLQG